MYSKLDRGGERGCYVIKIRVLTLSVAGEGEGVESIMQFKIVAERDKFMEIYVSARRSDGRRSDS